MPAKPTHPTKFHVLLFLAMLGSLVAIGCQNKNDKDNVYTPVAPAVSPYSSFTPPTAIPENLMVRRDYRLKPGDKLEIIYHVRAQVKEDTPYQLKIEDILNIRFPFNSELDQRQSVHSDGHISVILLGRVKAINLTIEQLTDELVEGYRQYLKDPIITVTFEESNVKIKELKKAITTAPRGQSRLVPIKPDGNISLPFIVDIRAAGRTITELHKALNQAYHIAGIDEIEVTVNVQTVRPQKIYVFGEFGSPGLLPAGHNSTLIQAIAMAGGIRLTGMRNKVILVRRHNLPVAEGVVLDFEAIMDAEKKINNEQIPDFSLLSYDIFLEDGDIVYVPRTDIAKINDWIDQVFNRGLRGIVPYSLSFDYQVKQVHAYCGF